MNKLVKYTIIGLFLFSCQNKRISNEAKSEFTIMISGNSENQIDYNPIIKRVNTIQLQTDKKCLIGEIHNFLYKNGQYYIHDQRMHTIFIFNNNGNYLSKIYKRGKGEGEYSELRDFAVTNDGTIHILSFGKIMLYNSNNKFLKQIKLPMQIENASFSPLNISTLEGDFYYLWNGGWLIKTKQKAMPNLLYKLKSNGKVVDQYFMLERKIPEGIRFSETDNGINIWPTFENNIIYKIVKNEIVNHIQIDFGTNSIKKNKLSTEWDGSLARQILDMRRNTSVCMSINNIYESANYVCFTYNQSNTIKQAIYSKKTGKVFVGIINPFVKIIGINENTLICAVEHYYLGNVETYHTKGLICNEAYNLLKGIKPSNDMNPLLIFYELQNF